MGQKTAPRTALGETSAKRWPKTVKFGTTLATSVNIPTEHYTNTWSTSNASSMQILT